MASSWVTATLISLMAVQVWTHTSSGRVFFYSKHSPSRAVTLLISTILIDVWQKFKAASICMSLMVKILNMPLHVSGSFCSLSTKNNSSFVFITQSPPFYVTTKELSPRVQLCTLQRKFISIVLKWKLDVERWYYWLSVMQIIGAHHQIYAA